MKIRLNTVTTLGLSLALLCATGAYVQAGGKDKAKAKIGEPAPAWTLKDANGKAHSLADYNGKIVVLEWTNPSCPYIVGCYGNGTVKSTLKQLKEIDSNVVYLSVNSTARGVGGTELNADDVMKQTAEFLKEHKIDITPLSDHDGAIGRVYGAKTTPHVFVIDAEGILRYQGALDNNPMGKAEKKDEPVVNYVVTAVQQIVNGETVSPDHVRSYGCSVKYAKNEKKSEKNPS